MTEWGWLPSVVLYPYQVVMNASMLVCPEKLYKRVLEMLTTHTSTLLGTSPG